MNIGFVVSLCPPQGRQPEHQADIYLALSQPPSGAAPLPEASAGAPLAATAPPMIASPFCGGRTSLDAVLSNAFRSLSLRGQPTAPLGRGLYMQEDEGPLGLPPSANPTLRATAVDAEEFFEGAPKAVRAASRYRAIHFAVLDAFARAPDEQARRNCMGPPAARALRPALGSVIDRLSPNQGPGEWTRVSSLFAVPGTLQSSIRARTIAGPDVYAMDTEDDSTSYLSAEDEEPHLCVVCLDREPIHQLILCQHAKCCDVSVRASLWA